jgi:hypothetical protein
MHTMHTMQTDATHHGNLIAKPGTVYQFEQITGSHPARDR